MNRRIVYIGAIPQDIDILWTNKNAMISDGWLAQAMIGTSTLFSGLACAPTAPAGMTVNVAPGSVFSQQNVDNSAYGSLNADTTDQIVKIGIALGVTNLSCPAPATTGYSVVYLIEAAFQEVDAGSTVLPYYNAANPESPWSGPNNTGVSQNTFRQDSCVVQVKAGTPAPTGTQVTPTPDVGFTGLWAVTVAQGQTTITSGNIALVSGAPFLSETLPQKISQASADARYAQITGVQAFQYNTVNDTSGAANTVTATVAPAITAYSQIRAVLIKVANNNTGSTVINLNTIGNVTVKNNGANLTAGMLVAGQYYLFIYDGTNFQLISNASSGAFSINIEYFTSSGTYTPTAGMVFCVVEMVGGGAGGGAGTAPIASGGGGAGEYAEGFFSASTIGANQVVTLGAAGTSGNNGGTTSFGGLLTAFGGTTGSGTALVSSASSYLFRGGPGGTGGSGGASTIHYPGWCGLDGNYTNIGGDNFITAGKGADSKYGQGGIGALAVGTLTAGGNASGYGAGGGGAAGGSGSGIGGTGSPGYCKVTEYII